MGFFNGGTSLLISSALVTGMLIGTGTIFFIEKSNSEHSIESNNVTKSSFNSNLDVNKKELEKSTSFEKDYIKECDHLATDPNDPNKNSQGVLDINVNTNKAINTCLKAIELDNTSSRLAYQLGRSYFLEKKYEEALYYLEAAADVGYPAAKALLSDLYLSTFEINDLSKDEISVILENYEYAFNNGYKPAKKSYDKLLTILDSIKPKFDLTIFEGKKILKALYNRDFNSLDKFSTGYIIEDAGIQISLEHYISGFVEMFDNPLIDIECVVLLKSGIVEKLQHKNVKKITTNVMNPNNLQNLANSALPAIAQLIQGSPGNIVNNVTNQIADHHLNIATLKQTGTKDAVRLIKNYGCNSKVTKNIVNSLNDYIFK